MRRIALALLTAVTALALTAAAPPPPRRAHFSDEQKADLDRISAYLNAAVTMKGNFVQVNGNGGVSRGAFWVQKPGKMRFEYAPNAQLLVVADGYSIIVRNNRLNTTDRYPEGSSPLQFVLSNTLNLKVNPMIVGIDHQNGSIIVRARSSKNRMTGNITMVFTEGSLELRQWTIVDQQGQQTTVSLSDVQTGVAIPGSTFVLADNGK
jgi:outer membrane lipoprotein-sorting protein